MEYLRYIIPVAATAAIAVWYFNPVPRDGASGDLPAADYSAATADMAACTAEDLQTYDLASQALADRVRSHDRAGLPSPELSEAAEAGDAEAMFELGVYYALVSADEGSQTQAGIWLEQAAMAGQAEAQIEIGVGYAAGYYGVTENTDLARAWLVAAAENGEARAQQALAGLYEDGRAEPPLGETRSPMELAIALRVEAGRQCFPAALRDLAQALETGRGLPRDAQTAARLEDLVAAHEAAGGFVD